MSSYSECNVRSRRPRPILKSLPKYNPLPFSTGPLDSPHVHFPPTPNLTSTIFTHSAGVYDRAPIIVSENVCELPERGGRCYILQSQSMPPSGRRDGRYDVSRHGRDNHESQGHYFHPQASNACEVERDNNRCDSSPVPDLLSTNSSSSSNSSLPSPPSDQGSDSSYGFLPTTMIPNLSSNPSLGETASVYPLEASLRDHHGTVPWQAYYLPCNQPFVSYVCPSSGQESKTKKTVTGKKLGRRSKSLSVAPAHLARFGEGFSDQVKVLEGCLGGF
jgi:hypothetical protein